MHVALVILHADPSRGGAERYTVDLAAALAVRGVEVTLVASTISPEIETKHLLLPVDAVTRLGQYQRFLDRLAGDGIHERFDVIHAMLPIPRCDVYHPHAGLAVEAVAAGHEKYDGLRRSLAGMANRFNRKRRRFATIERELLTAPEPPVVLCLSEYVKATVRKHYPSLPAEKLATLFNAVDLAKFDPAVRADAGRAIRGKYGLADDRVVALMIAQDFQRKGLAEAIAALPADDPRLVLLVVGKQDAGAYERLARERRVADRVIFAGPTTDPYAFYRAADFFVLPTRHDPCSLVVLESLAMGVPVISTAMNGACEVMADGVHGFVMTNPRDVDGLRSRYRLMMDDASRRAMSAACIQLRTKLSQEQHVDRLVEIYAAVARSNSGSPRSDEATK